MSNGGFMEKQILFPEADDTEWKRIQDLSALYADSTASPHPSGHPSVKLMKLMSDAVIPFRDASMRLISEELIDIEQTVVKSDYIANQDSLLRSLIYRCLMSIQPQVLRSQTEFMRSKRHYLTTSSSEDRYHEFAQWLSTPEGDAKYREVFPQSVVAAQSAARNFADEINEILKRYASDTNKLSTLGLVTSQRITDIDISSGDRHMGRAVAMIHFDDNNTVVYKPRSLRQDYAYHKLVEYINNSEGDLYFGSARVLERGEYGWMEFIRSRQGNSPKYAYRKMGELLGLLHLLRATDMHFENIVLHNNIPFPIDLETLLAAVPPRGAKKSSASSYVLSQTATFVGLLPSALHSPGQKADKGSTDVGALGYTPGQKSPFSSLVLHRPLTDEMHFSLEFLDRTDPALLPSLDPREEIALVQCGYQSFMVWAMAHKTELSNVIRQEFKGVNIRFVAEQTQRYSETLRLATHPDLHKDPKLHSMALWRTALFRHQVPEQVLVSEHEQLIKGDIPCFHFLSDCSDILFDSQVLVKDVLESTPLSHVLKGVQNLNEDELKLNLWLIQLSFAAKISQSAAHTDYLFSDSAVKASKSDINVNQMVQELTHPLIQTRVEGHGEHPPAWIGGRTSDTAFQYWRVDKLSLELFSGSVGVALNLVRSGVIFEEPAWVSAGESFFQKTLANLANDTDWENIHHGAQSGVESFLWAAMEVFELLGDEQGHQKAVRVLAQCLSKSTLYDLDVSSGYAGIVLAFSPHIDSDSTGTLADLVAFSVNSLVQGAQALDAASLQYSGFAHGVCGLYAALARTKGLEIENEATDSLIKKLLTFETKFKTADGGYRFGDEGTPEAKGWCHGLPGHHLAHAILHHYATDLSPFTDADLQVESERIRNTCFGGNISLCHGDIGNFWVLLDASRLLNHPEIGALTKKAAADYVERILPVALKDVNRHTITQSLMVGTGSPLAFLGKLQRHELRSPLWFGA